MKKSTFFNTFSRLFLIMLMLVSSVNAWADKTNQGSVTIISGKGTVKIDAYYKYWGSYYHNTGEISKVNEKLTVSKTKHNTDDGWVEFTATANTGYEFYGWCNNSDCSDTKPDKTTPKTYHAGPLSNLNVNLYTKFTPKTSTVNFFNEVGSTNKLGSCTVTYDAKYSDATGWISSPTKTGYTFVGWYKNDGTTLIKGSDSVKITSNTALYAHWKADISLDHQGGSSSISKIEVAYNSNSNLSGTITKPTKSGWEFHGYYTGTNGTGVQLIDKDGKVVANAGNGTYTDADKNWKYANGGITVYAYWALTYYGRANAYPSPVGNGKIWVSCNNNTPSGESAYLAESDYSNWQTVAQSNPTCRADYFALANPGYSFAGWFTAANGSGDKKGTTANYPENFTVTSTNSSSRTTITRYAYFTPNTYLVTFNANNGTCGTANTTVTYDATYGVGTNGWPTPTRTGYIFNGWFTAATNGTKIESTTKVQITDKQTLYAQWTPITYTVAFNANGGTGSMNNMSFTYDVAQNLTANAFARVGYKYNGWNTAANGSGTSYSNSQSVKNLTTTNNGTVTLYAQWNAVTVNSVASNGAQTTAPLTFTKPESKTATVVFNVSNADAVSHFTSSISGAGWTITNTTYASDKVTVTVQYTCAATTAQGQHTATVTLTSKATGGSSQTATVAANVNLTPSVTVNTNAISFGTYNLVTSSQMNQVVSLTFNENATVYSKTADANIAPFTTVWSADHKTLTVYFAPTVSGNWEKDLVVTVKNSQNPQLSASQTIHITGSAIRHTAAVTCNIANSYMVDDAALNLASLWTTTGDGTSVYTVESFTAASEHNSGLVSTPTITGSSLSLGQAGTLVIKLHQDQTTNYNEVNATKTITINKYVTAFSGAAYNMMVDGTQTAGYTYTHTSAAKPTANSADNFYYTIDDVLFTNSAENNGNNLVTFNPDNKLITACNAGTGKITMHQKETYKYTGATASYNVAVYKYNSTYAGVENLEVLVDESVTSGYTLTYTKPDASYVGADNIAAGVPTLGENSGDYYYTLTQNVTTGVTTGSPDATLAATYVPGTKTATGKNQGVATIVVTQKETYKYKAAAKTFYVFVSKHANAFTNNWGDWSKAMNQSASSSLTLTTNNTDYAAYPIEIQQTYGEEVATLTSNNATTKTVTSNTTNGYSTWYIYQPGSYKYNSAEADLMVTVGVPAPPTCYVVEDYSTHEFSTHINDWEGHFDTPIAINAPVDKIWFTACRQALGVDYFVVEYSVDNGAHWRTIVDNPGLSTSDKNYGPYSFQGLQSNEKVTHIRFGAKQGATLKKWYKNILVSRKAYLNIQDASRNNISTLAMPSNTIGNSVQAKFYVDYSTCASEILLESSNPHFTLSKTSFTANGDNRDTQKEEIIVNYTGNTVGQETAIISVYTGYQRRVLRITAETNRRVQTLTWQDGFNTDPITVPVGLKVDNTNEAALASSSNLVTYASGDETIIKIINGGYGFEVLKAGTTTITASEAGNATWSPVSETKTITATDKIIQEISWSQTLPLRMQIGDKIDLTASVYLRNTSTGEKTYSAERTAELTYTCPINDVISLTGNQITILGYGTTTVTANVAGNDDYEPAAPVTLTVIVREPSSGCETPLTFYKSDAIELFEFDFSFTDWNTPQLTSDEFYFDLSNGKPDKLSFQHAGAAYTAIGKEFYGGTVLVEEHVNNGWSEVANSRIQPTKNTWNRLENLQLNENADAIRFIRLAGGTGYHYFKDIQVTLRQYLRTAEPVIDFGDVKVGEHRKDTVRFEYSDLKGDVNATQLADVNWLTIANSGVVEIACGSHGNYELLIEFAPLQEGEWKDTIVVKDELTQLEIRVPLTANVLPADKFIYTSEGEWGTDANWNTGSVPGPTADVVVNANVEIVGNVTVNSLSIAEGATVTVAEGKTLTIGTGASENFTNYGNLHVELGAQVVVANEGELNVNNFTLDAALGGDDTQGKSGQLKNPTLLNINGSAYFDLSFDPSGKISYGWYDFTVPFTVNIEEGIYRVGSVDDRKMISGPDFVIMEADEASRANGGKGWRNLTGNVLQPGKLYTITFNYQASLDQNTFRFVWDGQGSLANGASYDAQCATGSGDNTLHGWNGMGNGMLRHGYPTEGYKRQAYNHSTNTYELVDGTKTFAVGSAFFIQVDGNTSINWTAADANVNRPMYAPERETQEVEEFRLGLRPEDAANHADVLYVSASEEATDAYVIGHDLLKMGTMTDSKKARMWATKGGKNLCDVEAELVNNNARCELGLFAPKAGAYTLSIEEAPEEATLYLTYNNRVIWNLSASAYTFDLEQGSTEGYGLRLVAEAPQMMTDIDETGAEAQSVKKVLIDNVLYLITPQGAMYDINGKIIK